VCEWGAIERVQALGKGKIIGLDTTVRTGAIMVRNDSKIASLADLRNVPIAVTWHAGTFYAAIEVMEAAGVPFDEIKLVHANDRLDALLSGKTEAAALMEPLVSRAAEAGARNIADLRWRGGIVAGDDVDDETAAKIMRALNRAVAWLAENESRSREELLRDLKPELRKTGLLPELLGVQSYQPAEFQEKVDWMMDRGFLTDAPRLCGDRARQVAPSVDARRLGRVVRSEAGEPATGGVAGVELLHDEAARIELLPDGFARGVVEIEDRRGPVRPRAARPRSRAESSSRSASAGRPPDQEEVLDVAEKLAHIALGDGVDDALVRFAKLAAGRAAFQGHHDAGGIDIVADRACERGVGRYWHLLFPRLRIDGRPGEERAWVECVPTPATGFHPAFVASSYFWI